MTLLFDSPLARIQAILGGGWGTLAPFNTYIQTKIAIPSDMLRVSQLHAPMEDPSINLTELDCAVSVIVPNANDGIDGRNNIMDPWSTRGSSFIVKNCVVYGKDNEAYIYPDTITDKSSLLKYDIAHARGQGFADLIKVALTYDELYEGGTDPLITWIYREGDTTVDPRSGNGRLIFTTTFHVELMKDNGTRYGPVIT